MSLLLIAILGIATIIGCSNGSTPTGDEADITAPTVVSTVPANGALGVAVNSSFSATFSEAMKASTISSVSFTAAGALPIAGLVVIVGNTAVFAPVVALANNTNYTASISTAATDLAGNALAATKTWSFHTVSLQPPTYLGTSSGFAILAKSGITNVPLSTSLVTGDIGVSPIAAAAITGFALALDGSGTFSTSALVTGKVYAADYAFPTPGMMTAAVSAYEASYTDLSGRPNPDFVELNAGDISSLTLGPGLYKWSTVVLMNDDVTLNGGPNDVFIFQMSQGFTIAADAHIILTGGVQAKNIYWAAFGVVSMGTNSHLEGTVLSQTSITLTQGASVNGRLFAQTNVTLDQNTITKPLP